MKEQQWKKFLKEGKVLVEARTIGTKNKNLVKKLALASLKKHTGFNGTDYTKIEDEVVDQLPTELWDTWEMADQEIRRIIDDVSAEWSQQH